MSCRGFGNKNSKYAALIKNKTYLNFIFFAKNIFAHSTHTTETKKK
jgi:hypothetical protein